MVSRSYRPSTSQTDALNSCADLGFLVSSGTVTLHATLDIDDDTGVARLELDDLEFTNVEDGSRSFAVRAYTRNGCSIDFVLVE